jgi:DNA adenine methylase
MQYLGSKARIAKKILPIILKDRKPDQYYVEPFVGGCNSIDKVSGPRIGNDSNAYLITLWKSLQNGWVPPTIVSKELYANVQKYPDLHPMELVCFVGLLCSFGGKWFGGYAANSKGDNYAERGARILLKQIKNLKDVEFYSFDYNQMNIPENSIIYCDPPYANTTQYKNKFDSVKFWEWCREKFKEGHKIFISEYSAPDDFECLVEIPVSTKLNKNKDQPRIEKLFQPKGQ